MYSSTVKKEIDNNDRTHKPCEVMTMKEKQVTQYKCDFCGKKKYAKGAMTLHETYCTMNPNRRCRMCMKIGEMTDAVKINDIPPLTGPQMVSMLPNGKEFRVPYDAILAKLPALRDATNNCPACILAAFRQAGLHPCEENGFDYSDEIKKFWDDYNDSLPKNDYAY